MKKYIEGSNSTNNHFLGKHYYGNYPTNPKIKKISNEELDEILSRIDEGYTVRFDNRLSLQQYQSIIKQIEKRKNSPFWVIKTREKTK